MGKKHQTLRPVATIKIKPEDKPEVLLIYVAGDNQCTIIGARRNADKQWRYSKPTYIPESGLAEFCMEMRHYEQYAVLDVRKQADLQTPGMGKATPVLLWKPHVDPREAAEAMRIMHTAILNSPD